MKFDEWQLKAIENDDEKVLLIAPPGSGKTTVLIQKILYMKDKGIDPERMLCLTFSRAGAINMKERFLKISEKTPWFGTVHSFCFDILRKNDKSNADSEKTDRSERSGIKQRKVLTDAQKLRAFNDFKDRYMLKHDEVLRIISLISLRRSGKETESSEFPEYILKEAEKAYEEFKIKNSCIDFDDMEEEFIELTEDEDFLRNVRSGFDAVLVDEFQDLNDTQLEIIGRISEGKRLFCVGDEDQCIYAFRGSNTEAMVDFEKYFKGGIKLYLIYNYRSSETIIQYANSVIEKNVKRNDKKIVNFRHDRTVLKILRPEDEKENIREIIDIIKMSDRKRTTGILARTNNELIDIQKKLIEENIPFSILDEPYNFLDTSLIRDICAFLNYFSYESKEDLILIFKRLGIMNSWEIMDIENKSDGLRKIDIESLIEKAEDHRSVLKLKKFRSQVKNFGKFRPYAMVDYVLYVFGYTGYLEKLSVLYKRSIHEYLKEAERFREFLKGFNTVDDFHEFRKEYERVMKIRGYPMERVVTSTIHGTKGMEFDNVIILNCLKGHIPHARSCDDEAERRLFYVGITRAKHDLYLMCPEKMGGSYSEISPYLK